MCRLEYQHTKGRGINRTDLAKEGDGWAFMWWETPASHHPTIHPTPSQGPSFPPHLITISSLTNVLAVNRP